MSVENIDNKKSNTMYDGPTNDVLDEMLIHRFYQRRLQKNSSVLNADQVAFKK